MRGHGEGSITKRKDGTYQGAISLENGKRLYFYDRKREVVAGKIIDALAEQRKGTLVTASSQTLEKYLTGWLADVVAHTVRDSTHESYSQMIRCHVLPKLGKTKLTKLTAQQLAALYALKLAEGLSPRSVQYLHAILHRALKQAVRWNLVARNVCDFVDAPRPKRHEIRPLSPAQIRQLLEAAHGDRLEALYVVAVTAGLREGEMLGLRWSDVELPAGSLHVAQQARRVKGKGITFAPPKTDKGRRTVALPWVAVEALKRHRVAQLEERLQAGSAWSDNDLVFANEVGKPIERQNLMRRSFVPLLERAGLPRIRFHDLRHSAATLLLSQGVHPKVVQERLGHSSIGLTMDTYSHVLPDMQREAAAKLDAIFGTARTV